MHRKGKVQHIAIGILLALSPTGTGLLADTNSSRTARHGIDVKSIAINVRPCQDFYNYANGHWLASNPIPPDRTSWGAGSELYEKNLAVLHQIVDEAARDTAASKGGITVRAAW